MVGSTAIDGVEWGAGDSDFSDRPNLLRAVLGRIESERSDCVVIEANIDDLNPEVAGFLLTRLFDAGALDAWFVPIQMKKNRPGIIVSALVHARKRVPIENVLLAESSAIGLRYYETQRTLLNRRFVSVQTPWGPVRIKTAWREDCLVNAAPEYEDCAELARTSGIPLKVIYQHAIAQFLNGSTNAD